MLELMSGEKDDLRCMWELVLLNSSSSSYFFLPSLPFLPLHFFLSFLFLSLLSFSFYLPPFLFLSPSLSLKFQLTHSHNFLCNNFFSTGEIWSPALITHEEQEQLKWSIAAPEKSNTVFQLLYNFNISDHKDRYLMKKKKERGEKMKGRQGEWTRKNGSSNVQSTFFFPLNKYNTTLSTED